MKTRMDTADTIGALYLCTVLLLLLALFLLETNLHGLGQRLFWGMQPPYHWVDDSDSFDGGGEHTAAWRHLLYVGANGVVCATAYTDMFEDIDHPGWVAYGHGFHGYYLTKEQAAAKAEEECR